MSQIVYRVIGADEPDEKRNQKHVFYAVYLEQKNYPDGQAIAICGLPFPFRYCIACYKTRDGWDVLTLTERERVVLHTVLADAKAVPGQWYAMEAHLQDEGLHAPLPIYPTQVGFWIGCPPPVYSGE